MTSLDTGQPIVPMHSNQLLSLDGSLTNIGFRFQLLLALIFNSDMSRLNCSTLETCMEIFPQFCYGFSREILWLRKQNARVTVGREINIEGTHGVREMLLRDSRGRGQDC